MKKNAITLFELTKNVQKAIKDTFSEFVWVIAEVSEIKINNSGHCYLELIQKAENEEAIIAKTRATIWANTYRILKPYFETATGYSLSVGLKILVYVSVDFHELYGFSLNIKDIEPSFTIGDLERQKAETLALLEKDGVLHMNRSLEMPMVPQRIAIISSETAAGYNDFVHQLENNEHGFKFYKKLFQAYMQGEKAEESIIQALDKIYSHENFFDVVVIIRGGGSQAELNCFNNYWLSSHIAQFSLPVITGIGHEKDETIVDIVAHSKQKTPTAAAEFLISRIAGFEYALNENEIEFTDKVKLLLALYNSEIQQLSYAYNSVVKTLVHHKKIEMMQLFSGFTVALKDYTVHKRAYLDLQSKNFSTKLHNLYIRNTHILETYDTYFKRSIYNFLSRKKDQYSFYKQSMSFLDPDKIIKRGFSITYYKNKVLKSIHQLDTDKYLKTKIKDGIISSEIKDIEN